MDALALLCNLFADGPSSRQQLVDAGIETLASVERATGERISEILGASPRRGERLRREAEVLRKRLHAGDLDREESHAPAPEPKIETPAPTAVERALAAWRRLDAEVASKGESSALPGFGDGILESGARSMPTASGEIAVRDVNAAATPAPKAPAAVGTPIPIDTLPLLDLEARSRLHAKGCWDLETLSAWDPLDVAGVVDAPLTRCIHLRFAVRKHLARGVAEGSPRPAPAPGVHPRTPSAPSAGVHPGTSQRPTTGGPAEPGAGDGDVEVVLRPVLGDIEPGSGGPFAD